MSENKDRLLRLILNENISAIEILADRLELTSDEVLEIVSSLLESGELQGVLTEDEKRFFKSDVKLSEAPKIDRAVAPPGFLNFNAKPAIATAVIGFLIIAGGVIVNANAADEVEQNFAAVLILVGLIITIAGLYCVSQRQTPS